MPTRKEIEEFEKIIPIKKGSYSFEEDNIIANNWKTFCKVSMQEICLLFNSQKYFKIKLKNFKIKKYIYLMQKFVQCFETDTQLGCK